MQKKQLTQKHRRARLVLELGVGLGLALAVVLTAWGQTVAAQVRADTLRLHILANSDSWEDQLLKIQVRNAVLAALPADLAAAQTPQQAAAALQNALPALRRAAQNALLAAHRPQSVALRLEQYPFAARDYGTFTLPAGAYTALRVELGAAAGRNWFCVLYPALCVPGAVAQYPTPAENALVFGDYEIRFALWDTIKGAVNGGGVWYND